MFKSINFSLFFYFLSSFQPISLTAEPKPDLVDEYFDDMIHFIVGEDLLKLSGYYSNESSSGCFHPDYELNPKVKITWINGILNDKEDVELSLNELCNAHGGNKIHYVYFATQGWTQDLAHSASVIHGYVSPVAILLADLWKNLIQEMGGEYNGGVIIHYAHSAGASNTLAAKSLLSEDEQRLIHVITFGSPLMIPDNVGFGSVINYISKRDGISMLDPIGYFKGHFHHEMNIGWVGSSYGLPLIDHFVSSGTYLELIKLLGSEFIDTYGHQSDFETDQYFHKIDHPRNK